MRTNSKHDNAAPLGVLSRDMAHGITQGEYDEMLALGILPSEDGVATRAARDVIARDLSVRETESLVKKIADGGAPAP